MLPRMLPVATYTTIEISNNETLQQWIQHRAEVQIKSLAKCETRDTHLKSESHVCLSICLRVCSWGMNRADWERKRSMESESEWPPTPGNPAWVSCYWIISVIHLRTESRSFACRSGPPLAIIRWRHTGSNVILDVTANFLFAFLQWLCLQYREMSVRNYENLTIDGSWMVFKKVRIKHFRHTTFTLLKLLLKFSNKFHFCRPRGPSVSFQKATWAARDSGAISSFRPQIKLITQRLIGLSSKD